MPNGTRSSPKKESLFGNSWKKKPLALISNYFLANLLFGLQLSNPHQLLYLTLTNLVGGGALATGFSLLAILATPFREQLAWSRYALTAIATTWYIPALLVTTRIRIRSKARPPVTSLVIGLGCVVGGFLLSQEVDITHDNSYFPSTY